MGRRKKVKEEFSMGEWSRTKKLSSSFFSSLFPWKYREKNFFPCCRNYSKRWTMNYSLLAHTALLFSLLCFALMVLNGITALFLSLNSKKKKKNFDILQRDFPFCCVCNLRKLMLNFQVDFIKKEILWKINLCFYIQIYENSSMTCQRKFKENFIFHQ